MAKTSKLSGTELHRHYEDDGILSFFISDDGTFAIVCNKGHGWYGSWEGLLTERKSSPAKIEIRGITDNIDEPVWLEKIIDTQEQ